MPRRSSPFSWLPIRERIILLYMAYLAKGRHIRVGGMRAGSDEPTYPGNLLEARRAWFERQIEKVKRGNR